MQESDNSQQHSYDRITEWIWYPGDFEIWLGNVVNNRRTERGSMFPPFWKQDSHWQTVDFTNTFTLEEDEKVEIFCEGRFNLSIDGKLQDNRSFRFMQFLLGDNNTTPIPFTVPAGTHRLNVKVWNIQSPPAIYIRGKQVWTDGTWRATYEDKIWIDENGTAHGSGIYVPVGCEGFVQPSMRPSLYRLDRKKVKPVSCETVGKGRLYDFGCETYGAIIVDRPSGSGLLTIYYGESREEALDSDHCETLDYCPIIKDEAKRPAAKAFRYVYIEPLEKTDYRSVSAVTEYHYYNPKRSGKFRCSDDELNRIWDTAAYTLDLTTLEFFVDGIKRDRWIWSGDAIQSYLMNYYLRFNTGCVRRTIRQLRGKDPVTAHINTIMDYTFYWFKSIGDYHLYTGNVSLIREIWPLMVTLMDYVLSRTNADGMAEGQPDDWIFVDWTDFPMHKRGTLCFEQILFCKALETMAFCAGLLKKHEEAEKYQGLADQLRQEIKTTFWSEDAHAYLHAIEDGKMNHQVTKFPNMFAILYGLSDEEEQREIMEHVMLNPAIPAITTPYMRFYELEALCMMGQQEKVLQEMKAYWGGMLREGATTFWEKYNPDEHGTQHLAMYGRPYGKSLCHAWGASPLYLIGKYFLGVRPTEPGYRKYEVRPCLGGLDWMEGDVPTPFGPIHLKMDRHSVTVSGGGHGTLIIGNRRYDIPSNGEELKIES